MVIATVPNFLDSLRQYRVLDDSQLAALGQVPQADPKALARDLVQRGWLTPYQVNQLFQGKGADLVVGPYLILERLGEGGMGQVFKVFHRLLRRVVAVKFIRPELLVHPNAVRRFAAEVAAAGQCNHPNIVVAHDAGEVGGKHFLTMEYVEGADLGRLLKQRGPLPVGEACDYIRQAACGLAHAHEKGLVHRDIKPSNLLVSKGQVKILDLGLARLNSAEASPSGSKDVTQPGAVVGTADYMAPEQAVDSHKADIRADIYSLGCTLYHLIAGEPPFSGNTVMEKLFAHHQSQATALDRRRPEVPPALAALVCRMMAKRPEDRFQTPGEVAAELLPFCQTDQIQAQSRLQQQAPAWSLVVGDTPMSSSAADAKTLPLQLHQPAPRRLWPWLLLGGAGAFGILFFAVVLFLFLRAVKPAVSAGPSAPAPATSAQLGPPSELTNSIGMKFKLVPAGKFKMGSPIAEQGHLEDEWPQHEVKLAKPLYVGVHEVTVGQFRKFIEEKKYQTEAEASGKGSYRLTGEKPELDPTCTWKDPGYEQTDSFPVVCVSWNDAVAFCGWLRDKEKKEYRLPTEAEWEYACRAGTTTPFHYGSSLSSEQANFHGSFPYGAAKGPVLGKPRPVGSYQPNAFGLYDMHGNASEWCGDYWADHYSEGPETDPQGPNGGQARIHRGGSWGNTGKFVRSAQRQFNPPVHRTTGIGFRVVMTPK